MTLRLPDLSRPLLVLVVALLVVLIVLPMGWLVVYAFTDKAGYPTLANFVTLFTDRSFIDPLVTTLIIAFSTSVVCCVVAAPLGWLVARTDMPLARTYRVLVMASLVTPPFVGAIAWEMLAAPNSGLLNQIWRLLTGASPDETLFDIYTLTGLIFVIVCYTFPYVFILVANALDRMPGELEDASSMLGASTWQTARRITIPLALPTLLAGALIAFLQALNLFGSPAILAIPAGFHTLTTKIWSLFEFPPKPELAAASALPLLVLTVALLRAQSLVLGRRGYAVLGSRYGAPRTIPLGALRLPAAAVAMLVLSLPLFLPYAALLNTAFSPISTQFVTPATFTLHNVVFTFGELSSTLPALQNTFVLATLSATIGALLALLVAYIVARQAVRGWRVLGFLATAPLAIPGIVLGVGLFLAYTRPPLTLYGTIWILLIAFVTIELPAAYQQLRSSFYSVHPDLEEAGRMLGATRLRTLWDITGPLLRASAVATWCFIFVAVIRELSAAVILFTSETKVVAVLIFDLKESGDVGAIAVLSLSIVAITTVVIALANRLRGRHEAVRPAGQGRRADPWPGTTPGSPRRCRWPGITCRLVHRPGPADAILTLGSFDPHAAVHAAAALWRAGLAPVVIMSGEHRPPRRRAGHGLGSAGGPRLRRRRPERGRACGSAAARGARAEHRRQLHPRAGGRRRGGIAAPQASRRRQALHDAARHATARKLKPEIELCLQCEEIDVARYFRREADPERTLLALVGDLHRLIVYPLLGFQVAQELLPEVIDALDRLVAAGYGARLVPGYDPAGRAVSQLER